MNKLTSSGSGGETDTPPGYAGVPPAVLSHTRGISTPSGYAGVPPASDYNTNANPYWHFRGYHPHFDNSNLIQSVTFRLHDSLPKRVVAQWKDELKINNKTPVNDKRRLELRERIDKYEDAGYGKCYLKNDKIAKIVQDTLLHFNGKRYDMYEWCVMPNHVHVLLKMGEGMTLTSIVHSWKSYTAKKANNMLNRSGDFWMMDYYDRFIRDEKHFQTVSVYIQQNPVKAGLVASAEGWQWSSAFNTRKVVYK